MKNLHVKILHIGGFNDNMLTNVVYMFMLMLHRATFRALVLGNVAVNDNE